MIIGIVNFPAVKPGREKDFLDWFSWSNLHFAEQQGFISRRLIKLIGEPEKYAAIIEFENAADFSEVARQPFHGESARRLAGLLTAMPKPEIYEEVTI